MANRALLVGINAYSDLPLNGCINDVTDVRDLLITKCGFKPDEIRVVTDAEATTANIKQQLQGWLLGDARPGDRLLFHFSGHGTQLPGRDGVVHDVICPVDFDFTEQHALSDVDFSAIFKAIPSGSALSWVTFAAVNSMAAALGQAATQAPQPMHAAASIAVAAASFGTRMEPASGALPVGAVM